MNCDSLFAYLWYLAHGGSLAAAAKSERWKFNSNLVLFILLWSLDEFGQPVVPASWRGSFRKDLAAAVRTPLRPFYRYNMLLRKSCFGRTFSTRPRDHFHASYTHIYLFIVTPNYRFTAKDTSKPSLDVIGFSVTTGKTALSVSWT